MRKSTREIYHHGIVIKFHGTETDSDRNLRKNVAKEDVWLVRSLKETAPQRHYESRALKRIHAFVEKITENWYNKLQTVRDFFEETIAKIVEHRQTEIFYSTSCLKEELQNIKDKLDQTEDFDIEKINDLKTAWFSTLYEWKTDMFEIEERSSKYLKTAIAKYLMKLVATRHNPCHSFDVMLTLVLELNHIIIGNVQAFIETEHDLGLLWDTHFKDWCVDYYFRAGLETRELEEEEEFEEEVPEIEGLKALDTILGLIVTLSEWATVKQLKFKKDSDLATIPHLAFLENYWECFKEKEKIVLEVLESEAKKLICIKKFLSSVKPEERPLFEKWASDGGYGGEDELKFTRTAEIAVYYLKELKTLILKTVELWQDFTDRLEAIKYIIEFSHYKQKIEIASKFQEWGTNMNIAVDELREAHSLNVLENMWNIRIDKLFLDYKNLLTQSLLCQKETLDTYTPMSNKTIQLFLSALDAILSDSSSVNYISETIPEKSIKSFHTNDLEECNFKMSEIIITCVLNVRRGYIECMGLFRDEIQENIDKLDTIWVAKKKADLDWQFSLKEEVMEQRMQRMKADVLEIRAEEIRMHDATLHLHFEAIKERLRYLASIDISGGIEPFVEEFNAAADEVAELNIQVPPRAFPHIIDKLGQVKKRFIDLCLRCDHNIQREFEHIDRYFEWMEQVNLQLLRDVKLFSESGNFSSDEVNNLLFVIRRIEKDMSHEKKGIYSKFKKGMELDDMEIGNTMEKFIEYMKTTQSKLLQRSNLRLLMSRAKRAIKREIFNGRTFLKKAESTLSFEDKQDASILPELLEAMKNVFTFLAIPEDFKELAGHIGVSESSTSIRQKTSFFPSVFKKGRNRSLRNKGKRSLVYKLEADEEGAPNNFLYKVAIIVSKCYEALRNQSSTSHTSGRQSDWLTGKALKKSRPQRGNSALQVIDSELIEIHRKSFIVWFDMVNESLEIYTIFRNKVSKVLNEKYKQFEHVWLTNMGIIQEQLYEQLTEFDKVAMKKKEKLKDGLKTMFGHPNHSYRLEEISNDAVAFCKSQTNDLKKIVINRRDDVKKLLMEFIDEKRSFIRGLFEKVENIHDNEELEEILHSLANHVLKRKSVKQILHNLASPREQKLEPIETKLGEEMESVSVDLSSSWKSATDLPALIKSIAGKVRWIISTRDKTALFDEKKIEVIHDLVELDEYGVMCDSLKKSLLTSAMKICRLGKLALAVYVNELQTWLYDWRTDCNRLTELYSNHQPPSAKDRLTRKRPSYTTHSLAARSVAYSRSRIIPSHKSTPR